MIWNQLMARQELCMRLYVHMWQSLIDTCISFQVTANEIHELASNQEETDTRVVLYLKFAAQMGYKSAVVRTPDTNILVILLHHAHALQITIYLDTGMGKHRRLINVSDLAERKGAEYCTAILGLYVFTGEDATSAFKGKGKVGPLKKLHNHQTGDILVMLYVGYAIFLKKVK